MFDSVDFKTFIINRSENEICGDTTNQCARKQNHLFTFMMREFKDALCSFVRLNKKYCTYLPQIYITFEWVLIS